MFKKLSKSGSITIPAKLRRSFGIEIGDAFDIEIKDGSVILKPFKPRCVFCGSTEEVDKFMHHHICSMCELTLMTRMASKMDIKIDGNGKAEVIK